MRISELDGKAYLGAEGVGENSYMILNYKEADPVVEPSGNEGEDTGENTDTPVETVPPVTYKVALDEIGRKLVSDLHIVTYDTSEGNQLKTITTATDHYETNTNVGLFINTIDRTALDHAVTDLQYDTTNKKFTKKIYNDSQSTDIVSTSAILNDMNLNYTDTSLETSYVTAVNETNGVIAVTRNAFNPSLTLTAGTSSVAPKIKTTVAGNTSSDITLTTATTSVYGVTKLSNDTNSNSEVLAATPKAVKDAIAALKKGQATGVAELDANGHVPASQLPSYVDDLEEYATFSNFPVEGESDKIYVDLATNTSYRWGGTAYVKIASDLSLGETEATAYRGDRGKQAYTHGVTNKGSAFASGLYKITTNNEGHVTAATAVGKSDITALGIPGSDTTYEMDGTYNSSTNKVATVSTVTGAVSGLAPIASPAFTNSISLNRKTGTTPGDESLAVGNETAANGPQTVAFGRSTISNGDASFTCGSGLVAAGGSEFVIGTYNKLPAQAWQPNTAYAMNDYVVYQDKLYYCASPHTSGDTFEEASGWYHAKKYLLTIGDGNNSSGRSNAFVVDIWGNAHLRGDLYVGCDDDSQGGNKVIAIPEPPTSDGTYTLQCSVTSGVVTYNWVSTT